MNLKKTFEKNRNVIKYSMCGLVIAVTGVVFVLDKGRTETVKDTFAVSEAVCEESEALADSDENLIYVYVCGMVNAPGVISCEENIRVYEAIELAGGIKEEADVSGLNLADKARDGQKIYVPAQGEVIVSADGTVSSLVNINTASKEELMSLPGIGESRAKDIISYRNANGAFGSIEDIKKVSGIKEAAFDKIKDLISV